MGNVIEVCIPKESANDETVTIIRWLVADGQAIQVDQMLAEVETSKAVFEIPSPAAGVIQLAAREGTDVPVGDALCYIGDTLESIEIFVGQQGAIKPAETALSQGLLQSSSPAAGFGDVVPVVPAAQAVAPTGTRFSQKALELIHHKGLREGDFAGKGLLRERDILAALGGAQTPGSAGSRSATANPAVEVSSEPSRAPGVKIKSQRVSRSKRTEIRRLTSSSRATIRSAVTVAVVTHGTAVMKETNPTLGETLSGAVIFETARLLRKYPLLNAFFARDQVNMYQEVNIGYALDAGYGLKVPVVMNADTKSLPQLVEERRQYLRQYLNNQLPLEALGRGTFTITDLSNEGVLSFDPLINDGQSAVLGIASERMPADAPSGFYNLILAFDHQVIEGRTAARFLNDLKQRLESYEDTLLQKAGGAQEPTCSRCLTPLDVLQRNGNSLIQTLVGPGETKAVCSICLSRW